MDVTISDQMKCKNAAFVMLTHALMAMRIIIATYKFNKCQ